MWGECVSVDCKSGGVWGGVVWNVGYRPFLPDLIVAGPLFYRLYTAVIKYMPLEYIYYITYVIYDNDYHI